MGAIASSRLITKLFASVIESVLGSSGCVSEGAVDATVLRCVAQELRASRRRSLEQPCLRAMGSVVLGSRWGCTPPAILPLLFSGDRKLTEFAGS